MISKLRFLHSLRNYNLCFALILCFSTSVLLPNVSFANTIVWEKSLGGTQDEQIISFDETQDGGYIVGLNSQSSDIDASANNGYDDIWIVKLDANKNIVWEKNYGGSEDDYLSKVLELPSGNFIITGTTRSYDLDVSTNYGGGDFWVLKLNSNGDLLWEKNFGSSFDDFLYTSIYSSDHKIVSIGTIQKADHDVSNYFPGVGPNDIWVTQMDTNGNLIWEKNYGGTDQDWGNSIIESNDGNYVFTSTTRSTDNDLLSLGTQGTDSWVVKIDKNNGNKLWSKLNGGSGDDEASAIIQSQNSDYLIIGRSSSNDPLTFPNKGLTDLWVYKLDNNGSFKWSKTYGGNNNDVGQDIIEDSNGRLFVFGETESTNGDVSSLKGNTDFWQLQIDSIGNIITEKTFGGTSYDFFRGATKSKMNDDIYIFGSVNSSDGDVTSNNGLSDGWIIKLGEYPLNIFGTTDICEKDTNQSYIYYADYDTNNVIQWVVEDGIIVADNGNNIEIKWTGPNSRLKLHQLNANNIEDSLWISINIHPTESTNLVDSTNFITPYDFGSQQITSPGTYTNVYQTIYSCDSIVTLTLLQKSSSLQVFGEPLVCENFLSNTFTYYEAGFVKPNTELVLGQIGGSTIANGGDSISVVWNNNPGQFITLIERDLNTNETLDSIAFAITIAQTLFTTTTDSIATGDSIHFGTQTIYGPGTYIETFLSLQNGCDSIVSLNVIQKSNNGNGECSDLFFSEYIEGSAFNKALEIYNPSNQVIDLTSHVIFIFNDGNTSPNVTIPLTGNIQPKQTFVIAHTGADSAITSKADILAGNLNFNGNDAITLEKPAAIVLDAIGIPGIDPGLSWDNSNISTLNQTLVRRVNQTKGVHVDSISSYDPAIYWYAHSTDEFSFLGNHASECNGCFSRIDTSFSETICAGDSISFNGTWISSAGTHTANLKTLANCDSIVTINVAIDSNCTQFTTILSGKDTLCNSTISDTLYYSSSAAGATTIHWTVNEGNIVDQIGQSIVGIVWNDTLNGQSVEVIQIDSATMFADTTTLHVQILPAYNDSITDSLATGGAFSFGDTIITSPGVYTENFYTSLGCDSIVTMTVLLKTETSTNPNLGQLTGDSIVCDNYTGTTIYTYTAEDDSQTTSTWNIIGGTILNQNDSAIQVIWGNVSGQSIELIQHDSVNNTSDSSTLHILIGSTYNDTIYDSVHVDSTYIFGNQPINTPGIYTTTETTYLGCDSITVLHLTHKFNSGDCDELFISEYIEGTSNNKALEIYNPTSQTIDLSGYEIAVYSNGSNSASSTLSLSGTISSHDVYVVTNTNASFDSLADQTFNNLNFNGNDVVALTHNTSIIDVIGELGVDPTVSWDGNGVSTIDQTLIRKASVKTGISSYASGTFDPSVEWISIPTDETHFLGYHASSCNGCSDNDTIENKTLCLGDSMLFNNQWITVAGTYTEYLTTIGNCDSIVTLNVSIDSNCNPVSHTTGIIGDSSICTNSFTDTLTYIAQYDSNSTITWSANLGNVISQNGDTIHIVWDDTTGQSLQVIQTDSLHGISDTASITIDVMLTYNNSLTDSIGSGDTLYLGNTVITAPGVYIDSTQSIYGCDSITTLTVLQKNTQGPCDGLYISEYVEGNSNNNAIEIYNGSNQVIDLTDYQLKIYANGLTQASYTIPLSGLIGALNTHVVVHSGAATNLQNLGDQIVSDLIFNGNDAIVLEENGTAIDIFGAIGNNPGLSWTGGGVSTLNQTLTRKPLITEGIQVNPTNFDPSTEWNQFPVDHFAGIGEHTAVCQGCPTSNEVSVVLDICQGDSAFLNGEWTTSPGLYVDSLLSQINCDSIVKTQLNLVSTINSTLTDSICTGKTYNIEGQTLTGPGTYTINTIAAAGCDSVITLTLYEKTCGVGIDDLNANNGVTIYPNPSSRGNYITIEIPSSVQEERLLEIYDNQHRMVFTETINTTKIINSGIFAKGMYTVKITSKTTTKPIIHKLIIE